MLACFKKFIYLRIVYICMNDVNKKEDDPYYETYVKEFYKRYEYFVGFEILQNNMREQYVH